MFRPTLFLVHKCTHPDTKCVQRSRVCMSYCHTCMFWWTSSRICFTTCGNNVDVWLTSSDPASTAMSFMSTHGYTCTMGLLPDTHYCGLGMRRNPQFRVSDKRPIGWTRSFVTCKPVKEPHSSKPTIHVYTPSWITKEIKHCDVQLCWRNRVTLHDSITYVLLTKWCDNKSFTWCVLYLQQCPITKLAHRYKCIYSCVTMIWRHIYLWNTYLISMSSLLCSINCCSKWVHMCWTDHLKPINGEPVSSCPREWIKIMEHRCWKQDE